MILKTKLKLNKCKLKINLKMKDDEKCFKIETQDQTEYDERMHFHMNFDSNEKLIQNHHEGESNDKSDEI